METLRYWIDEQGQHRNIEPTSIAGLSDYESLIPRTDKDLCEYDLLLFMTTYLQSATSPFAEVHYEVSEVLQSEQIAGELLRLLALFPREHAKTTLITFGYVLWCICYQKKRNIVIASDSKGQAKEFLRNIKTELETNEKILRDFGDLVPDTSSSNKKRFKGKWDETHIITANQVQIKLISPSTQIRGLQFNLPTRMPDGSVRTEIRRPDLIIVDDVLNDKYVKNKIQRDKLEDWFFSAVFNALDSERGGIVVIGTVLHNDDLLNRMWKDTVRTAGWTKLKCPACSLSGSEENLQIDKVLWPDRWSGRKLLKRRVEIGSLAFAREFLLEPVEEGAKYFNSAWYEYFYSHDTPIEWADGFKSQNIGPAPQDLICVTSIDPAISKKESADYSVVMTAGFSPTRRNYYLLDLFRERCTPQKHVRMLVNQYEKWSKLYSHIGWVIESYAYQDSIRYWLKQEIERFGLYDARIITRAETGVDKTLRCSVMSPMVEQRRLYFPLSVKFDLLDNRKTVVHPAKVCEDELDDFDQGPNDDTVDALQRCYSVLIREEKKYADMRTYGPSGAEHIEAMLQSGTYGSLLKSYFQ